MVTHIRHVSVFGHKTCIVQISIPILHTARDQQESLGAEYAHIQPCQTVSLSRRQIVTMLLYINLPHTNSNNNHCIYQPGGWVLIGWIRLSKIHLLLDSPASRINNAGEDNPNLCVCSLKSFEYTYFYQLYTYHSYRAPRYATMSFNMNVSLSIIVLI